MFLITSLFPLIGKILDKVLPDPSVKAQVQKEVIKAVTETIDNQKEIVLTELKSDKWYQNAWRSIIAWGAGLMVLFILFNASILRPFVYFFTGIVLPEATIPDHLWDLLTICLTGYIGYQWIDKIINTIFRR